MVEFVLQHQFWAAAVVYWIFSAAVSAMPDPNTGASSAYLWLYRFLHTTAGNLTTALLTAARYRACASPGSKIPGLKMLVPVLMIPLVLVSATACAAHFTVHPQALNTTDSAVFDTLLVAETVIDRARTEYQAQHLPANAKDALNTLIASYNVARESWLTYRGAVTTNVPSDDYLKQLNKNLSDLTIAIRNLKEIQ